MSSFVQNGFGRELPLSAVWERLWGWWRKANLRSRSRRLRLTESLPLGEKRFIAVIEFESERFLIGGGAAGLTLLARLGEGPEFSEVLSEWCERQR